MDGLDENADPPLQPGEYRHRGANTTGINECPVKYTAAVHLAAEMKDLIYWGKAWLEVSLQIDETARKVEASCIISQKSSKCMVTMAQGDAGGRQEGVSSSDGAASVGTPSRNKKKRSASSPGSQIQGKREKSVTTGTKRSTTSLDTQRQHSAAGVNSSAKKNRKRAEAKEGIQDVGERVPGELTVATQDEEDTENDTDMGHNGSTLTVSNSN